MDMVNSTPPVVEFNC